jgi:two-component system, cell cycle sensor histidine kinase and response regulator CckA
MENDVILLVEDEKIVALEIQEALKKLGYQVPLTVSSGEEAILKAKEIHPVLVLMDIMLKKKMDGIEAARRIREEVGTPIVFLTAHGDKETFLRSQLAEPFDFIVKPVIMKELSKRIEMALFRSRIEKEIKEKEQWLADTLDGISDAIITTDIRGRIRFANAAASALTGWLHAELIDRPVQEMIRLSDIKTGEPRTVFGGKMLYDGTYIHPLESLMLATRKGTSLSVGLYVAPIRNHHGQLAGAVITVKEGAERLRQ